MQKVFTMVGLSILTLTVITMLSGCGLIFGPHGTHMGPAMWDSWGPGWRGSFINLAVFGLLIWGGFSLVRLIVAPKNDRELNNDSYSASLDILNQRYARGEIGKQEYEAKKRDILS